MYVQVKAIIILQDYGRKLHSRFLLGQPSPVTYDNFLKAYVDVRQNDSTWVPLIRYVVDDLSVNLHLYGGSDFGKPFCH